MALVPGLCRRLARRGGVPPIYAPPEAKTAKPERQAESAERQLSVRAEELPRSRHAERLRAHSELLDARPQTAQMMARSEQLSEARASLPIPAPIQRPANRTGLPDNLKEAVEARSGLSMDDVKVHYGSSKPAGLGALAYTQGTDIHVGPGQERHLAHEAWHVVQQKQGRVKPRLQMKDASINDDVGLEREADSMAAEALAGPRLLRPSGLDRKQPSSAVVQRVLTVGDDDYRDLSAVKDKAFQLPKDGRELIRAKLQEWAKEELAPESANPHTFGNWPAAFRAAREAIKVDQGPGMGKGAAGVPSVGSSSASAAARRTPTLTALDSDEEPPSKISTAKPGPKASRASGASAAKSLSSMASEESEGEEDLDLLMAMKLSAAEGRHGSAESSEDEEKSERAAPPVKNLTSGSSSSSSSSAAIGARHHFKSGAPIPGINLAGGVLADDTGKKLSGTASRDALKRLGVGEHVASGHFGRTVESLASEARLGKSTFSWTNHEAFLNALEAGRMQFLDKGAKTKMVEVDLPDGAGQGVVVGSDGKSYKVVPRRARIVRKEKGDFTTAYGITEEDNPLNFGDAYHSHEAI